MNIFDQIMQSEYDSWGENPPTHAWCSQAQTEIEIAFLKKTLQLSPKHAKLDLFCSWGRHAIALSMQGYNVSGIDVSVPLINRAKETAKRHNCTAKFKATDFYETEFSSEFDVVYSIQSSPFEAWRASDEIVRQLSHIRSALKSGGLYLFGWPDNYNRSDVAVKRWSRVLKEKGITDFERTELPFHYYGYREQSAILKGAGLSIVSAYNTYDINISYDENKLGLIIVTRKR